MAAQHGIEAHSDGQWHKPVQTRSDRFHSYDVQDFAEITGREPFWKLTPQDRLAPLLGDLDGSRYPLAASSVAGVSSGWVPRDDSVIGSSGKVPEDRVSASAWSSFAEAFVVNIDKDASLAESVVVSRSELGDAPRAAHTVITAGSGSSALVVLDNRGLARLAENVEVVVGDGARLTLVSIQDWNRTATHAATHFIKVGRDAVIKHIIVTLGGDLVRITPSAHFGGPGGSVSLLGLYFADAGQHFEQQLFVDHNEPNCVSRVTYKGALQGESARTVWIGDVLIRENAYQTDTYEQNRNLILTDGARADSVPNLEIETGEIVGAGHASATGRFDDEHLFYLQSRGISESEARRLVVQGFLMEIVQQIGDAALEERLVVALEAELAHTVI